MKKLATLFILLLQLCFAYSQDEITYKQRYKDSTRYNITIDKESHSETNYYGSDDFLLKLKAQRKDNPSYADEQYTNKLILRTGNLIDSVNYPLTLELVNIADVNKQLELPNGALVYGHGSIHSLPHFDSIPNNIIGDRIKGLEWVRFVFKDFTIPTKKLKQGESFAVPSHYYVRINGTLIDLTTTTTYTFNGIANGIANFDITETYAATPGEGKFEIKAEGKGSGQMQYDTINSVTTEFEKDTEVDVTMDLYNGNSVNNKLKGHYKRVIEMGSN